MLHSSHYISYISFITFITYWWIGVVFKENCVQLKARAVAVQLVYWFCGYWRCVRTSRVTMIKVMNCDRVTWDEFSVVAVGEFSSVVDDETSYIFSSFRMSFSLNPFLWPIVAFASCNINRHLHFSCRPTQYS